jgi:copper transporter 1
MLWNWNTVDSCFISESWHITSKGMFAGSCIGVICLVICLEFLRRLGKEYDRFLLRQHELRAAMVGSETSVEASCLRSKPLAFTPSVLQQSLRALLHVAQFAVAYFVMLWVLLNLSQLAKYLIGFKQTCYVLQWLLHYLHSHWCLHWFFYLLLGIN